jgi:hypothetical protein
MRLPRVRFTVRTMMIAVAITATLLGLLEKRRATLGKVSLAHSLERDQLHLSDLELYLIRTPTPLGHNPPASVAKAEATRTRAAHPLLRFIQYHEQMADKYRRASGRPWLPVASDPPPPPKPSREEYIKATINPWIRAPGESWSWPY